MILRLGTVLFFLTAAPTFSQAPALVPKQVTDAGPAQAEVIPERTLKFTPINSDSTIAISPVTSLSQCDTEGYLFLDMLDPKEAEKTHRSLLPGQRKSDILTISDFGPSRHKHFRILPLKFGSWFPSAGYKS